MLADAIRSETYRFSKNRMAVFWSVLFVPILFLAIGTAVQLFAKTQVDSAVTKLPPQLLQGGPLDLGQSLTAQVGEFANPIVLLFVLIGAAVVYAGDYRWETWRLTSARNSRINLVLGKVVLVLGLVSLALLTWVAFGMIGELAKAAIFSRPLAFVFAQEQAGQMAGFLALVVTRLMQFTMIGLLAAVLTRSLLATLFVPMAVAFGQFLLMQGLPILGWGAGDLQSHLLVPGLSHDVLKTLIQGGPEAAAAPDGVAWKAGLSLALWTVVPLVAAVAWFRRQDLSKE